ncbi:MAG: lysozyme [Pseudomonadota bacterium]
MNPSQACIDLVKSFESFRAEAYRDMVGVWTIGYGHTKDVQPGDVITQHQADIAIEFELGRFGDVVDKYVTAELNQNQFDALCSFTYNLGEGNFKSSTLLKMINGGQFSAAADQFKRWDMAGGKHVPGLLRRRMAERDLFVKPV